MNCSEVLRAARLQGLFDSQVDGNVAHERGLAGKPAPDTYLEAARMLSTTPQQSAVYEDALAGVEAGRAGGIFPAAHPTNDARAIHHLCSGLIADRLNGTSALSQADAVAAQANTNYRLVEALMMLMLPLLAIAAVTAAAAGCGSSASSNNNSGGTGGS